MSATPGPWRWSKNPTYPTTDLIGPDHTTILQIYESHGGGYMPADADAGLIAAAPDLLKIARASWHLCESLLACPEGGTEDLFREISKAASAAIAKAEGAEQPV